MDFIRLFFPIVLIVPFAIFAMSIYLLIKHIRLYLKHGKNEDLKECEEYFLFMLASIFISLIFFI